MKPPATSAAARVSQHWGENAPDWVMVLAEACDEASQAHTAKEIGYSAGAVSAVIAAKYKGDLSKVEDAVMGAFRNRTVQCPELGEIAANVCLANQRRPPKPNSRQAIRLWQACRSGCPNFRQKGEKPNDQ